MASRGFLIRFIDIGLIVLFGFIMISDIENSSVVDLATPNDAETDEPDTPDPTFVTVRITADGNYTVERTEDGTVLGNDLRGVPALEQSLGQLRVMLQYESGDIVVLINPDAASIVQHTVDVMDICDRLGFRKSLQTDFTSSAAGA